MKKEYWLASLLSNRLKLRPPRPVRELLYATSPHYQDYPKVAANGVIRDRYLPQGVVQMCCCLHNGKAFVGLCQQLGYIREEEEHGQCFSCKKYLHTKCSVYDIINQGTTDEKDQGTTLLCTSCMSHSQSKIVERYWEDHNTKFRMKEDGHLFAGIITWIPYPAFSPPAASGGGDGPPPASGGGEESTQHIMDVLGGAYNSTYKQNIYKNHTTNTLGYIHNKSGIELCTCGVLH